jgi:hypothetical protein
LLARKIAGRLGLYREDARLHLVPAKAAYPVHWKPALRSWLQHVPLKPAPHPFNRVFGHDFDEALLLRLCREGPSREERGLAGDIKLIWDYSRSHALFSNVAAGVTGIEECAAFVRRWQEANTDTNGPAWICAMDTAIRAVNWAFADAISDGALAVALGQHEFFQELHRHGQSIWRRLEVRVNNTNHYLANLLGLAVVGAIFPEDSRARGWREFAQDEFPKALLEQTRHDGGLNEASLRYHAFVTDMALLFRLVVGAPLSLPAEVRLRQMCQIVADFKDVTGDVFPLGDDDSGRVLAVDSASAMGRGEILLRLASTVLGETFKQAAQSVCPQSGWWVQRDGDFTLVLDFGGVGLHGLGGHAHNDDLSICLEWRGHPLIVDPGTFLYSSDPEARNRFRSTASHNGLQVDGCEQRELTSSIFALPGRDGPLDATLTKADAWEFRRQDASGVMHRRVLLLNGAGVLLRDYAEGSRRHRLRWSFLLHPGVRVQLASQGFLLTVPEVGSLQLSTSAASPDLKILESEYSPAYAQKEATRSCTAEGDYILPYSVEWSIRAVG